VLSFPLDIPDLVEIASEAERVVEWQGCFEVYVMPELE
jgi:hypothetical protein